MLEQRITWETVIRRDLKVTQCLFGPVQQRVRRPYCISDVVEMLKPIPLLQRLADLDLCPVCISRVGGQQRLHGSQGATSVLRLLCKERVDSFLSFVPFSKVLKSQGTSKSPKTPRALLRNP